VSKPKKHASEKLAAARAKETLSELKSEVLAPTTGRMVAAAEARAEEIRGIEDRIQAGALEVIEDSMWWRSLDPEAESPPEEWIAELGRERARQRFRVAKANWMSAKEAPIGIRTATLVSMGITKARAMEKQVPKSLNVAFVQMSAPLPEFPEIVVKGRK